MVSKISASFSSTICAWASGKLCSLTSVRSMSEWSAPSVPAIAPFECCAEQVNQRGFSQMPAAAWEHTTHACRFAELGDEGKLAA